MVNLTHAIASAKAFAVNTLGAPREGLLLEEVKSDSLQFHITLSFPHRRPEQPITNPLLAGMRSAAREFKTFEIDKDTGDVLNMLIRNVD